MRVLRLFASIEAFRAAVLTACVTLASCTPDAPGNGVERQKESVGTELPSVPLPIPPLDRPKLLAAAARTASAVAAGTDVGADLQKLDGSAFELRVRFGCEGALGDLGKAPFGWNFDEANRTLRVRASPTISEKDEFVSQIARNRFEAVEGFWIPRPWILDSVCPVAPGEDRASFGLATAPFEAPEKGSISVERRVATQPRATAPKVGIAQFFTSTDARTLRRSGRPYEVSKTLEPNKMPGRHGFNLVLSGRLKALPGEKAISCLVKYTDAPPDCIISVKFDRVWIEDPDDKQVIADWGSG